MSGFNKVLFSHTVISFSYHSRHMKNSRGLWGAQGPQNDFFIFHQDQKVSFLNYPISIYQMSYASKVRGVSNTTSKVMSNIDIVNSYRKTSTQPKNTEQDLENARRTTAFVAIYNKANSMQTKAKTQMCRSVQQGIPCKFGSRCSYAHNKEELKVQKCAFGTTCKTRYSKTNPCQFDHTEEHTPEPASRPTLAQEMKSRWEQEEIQIQALITKFNANRPKLEPFLIDLSEDDQETDCEESDCEESDRDDASDDEFDCSISSVEIPVRNVKITNMFPEEDEETKAIQKLNAFVVPRIIIDNTMDLF
jgi:hypothetical protein